jgi:hypothetical protein
VSIERQVRSLVRVAQDYRTEHCSAILGAAQAQARRILAQAHAVARSHLREVLTEVRERADMAMAEAETELVMQRRLNAEKRLAAALEASTPELKQALHRYWQSPVERARWVEQHLKVEIAVLPPSGWTIFHPSGWAQEESDEVRRLLQAKGVEEPLFESDAALPAGIRVACGLNLLDASFDGLLADHALIQGRLLHYLGTVE